MVRACEWTVQTRSVGTPYRDVASSLDKSKATAAAAAIVREKRGKFSGNEGTYYDPHLECSVKVRVIPKRV